MSALVQGHPNCCVPRVVAWEGCDPHSFSVPGTQEVCQEEVKVYML